MKYYNHAWRGQCSPLPLTLVSWCLSCHFPTSSFILLYCHLRHNPFGKRINHFVPSHLLSCTRPLATARRLPCNARSCSVFKHGWHCSWKHFLRGSPWCHPFLIQLVGSHDHSELLRHEVLLSFLLLFPPSGLLLPMEAHPSQFYLHP